MTAQTFDLQALGVEELTHVDAMEINGGGPGSWLGELVKDFLVEVVWDTVKEIYNSWDEFVDAFWMGVYAWDE